MNEPLDDRYFAWLYGQVGNVKTRALSRTYWSLLRQLFKKEFVWFVPNDDNRVEDGRDLREEFLDEFDIGDVDPGWLNLGCSMLELLVALSRRLAFETDGNHRVWFWHLIEQLDLEQYNDRVYDLHAERVIDQTCDRVIWRRYKRNGEGGLFPLRRARQDQRQVELWYQMSAYLLEL